MRWLGRLLLKPALLAAASVALLMPTAIWPASASSPAAPDPSTQSRIDGCQRDPVGLVSGTSPEWVYVYNTPPSAPAPPPQWASGVLSSANPRFQAVHTSGGDLPSGHDAYDFNMNILPDPQYAFLLAGDPIAKTGNYAGDGEETGRLHVEWEDTVVPKFAWPEPGDRVTLLGSWVWDCGHWGTPTEFDNPDYVLPGEVAKECLGFPDHSQCHATGEQTEFHPYRALWVDRGLSPNSQSGETEADLFISTNQTRAGKEADCAHQFAPVLDPASKAAYRNCVETRPSWQDVSGHYSFLLPAPPSPAPGAQLQFRMQNHGSSSSAPTPKVTREGDGIRVEFQLKVDPGQDMSLAYSFFAGWSTAPAAGTTHLRVHFEKLIVHRAMDPGCSLSTFGVPPQDCPYKDETLHYSQISHAPGDWNLYYDVNGIWGGLNSGYFRPFDETTYMNLETVDLYVPSGAGWRLYVHGRECDLGGIAAPRVMQDCPQDTTDIADDNDVPGMVLDSYASAAASVGVHDSAGLTHSGDPTSTCPDTNPHGCYEIVYSVSVVPGGAVAAQTAAVGLPLTRSASSNLPGPALAAGAAGAVLLALGAASRRRHYRIPSPSGTVRG